MINEKAEYEDAEFAESITRSIANIKQVWEQINSLKNMLDQKIETALKEHGFAARRDGHRVIPRDLGEKWDEYGSVCERWAWAYPVKRAGRGNPARLGQLYLSIALAPSHTEATKDFHPYISVSYDNDVHYSSADWKEHFLDWNHPTIDGSEFPDERPIENIFPKWAISKNFHLNGEDGDQSIVGFLAYLPLNRITSETVDSAIINPTIEALKRVTGI